MSGALRKRFGQHFLHDTVILRRILEAIHPVEAGTVVEIGPGRGALTDYLLMGDSNSQLILIEIDRDLVAFLRHKYQPYSNVSIYQQDVLTVNFSTLKQAPLRVVGNLPYNISTPLLFNLFSQIECIQDMHFMLQKEVVMRLVAEVGSSDYGRLSVMSQYFCDNILLFTVPSTAFTPPPQVESAVVRLVPRKHRPLNSQAFNQMSLIVTEAFTYRRKTVANALKKFIRSEDWKAIEINPQLRPQELTVQDFIKISDRVLKRGLC